MEYEVIFDAAVSGYKAWPFPFMGLVIMVGGILVFYFRSKENPEDGKHPLIKGFKYFFFGFGLLWTTAVFSSTYSEYLTIKNSIQNNDTKVVEGLVTNYQPYSGTSGESFCVDEACFEYSDDVVTSGFNNTAHYGGPIREHLPVRVTYVEGQKNLIVRLEIGQ